MDALSSRTTLSIDGETYQRLVDLARRNERTASAEARLAIRAHLKDSAAATAEKPAGLGDVPAGRGSLAGGSNSLEGRGRSSARSAGRAHEHGPGHERDAD